MRPQAPAITGFGSVSPFGPVRGLICTAPRPVTAWPGDGLRHAFLVKPFRPADVVPGLKTRRLDRLSTWCLVATALAIADAGINLETEDRARVAVVLGTGFGCIELTEAFYRSIAEQGHAKADPIIFPETLANSPAAHVARVFGLRGPNITVSEKGLSGEAAFLHAAALLRTGSADLAIVLAGDVLTQTMYAWYEAAGMLSKACFGAEAADGDGFVPGESATAVVLESGGRAKGRGARVYAAYRSGCMATHADVSCIIRRAMGSASPAEVRFVVSDAKRTSIREILGDDVSVLSPKSWVGESDSSGLLRLLLALSWTERSGSPLGVLIGTSAARAYAALCFELP